MHFKPEYPPRAETPFTLKGRYPGLRSGRAASHGDSESETAGVAHSGIVARPTVAYRCGGSTGIRRPLGSAGVPTPEPVVPGQPAKDRGGSCSASGHPHLFPVEPLRRNRTGTRELGDSNLLEYGQAPRKRIRMTPLGLGSAISGGGRARVNMSKHIQKKPLAVDLTRFLSL